MGHALRAAVGWRGGWEGLCCRPCARPARCSRGRRARPAPRPAVGAPLRAAQFFCAPACPSVCLPAVSDIPDWCFVEAWGVREAAARRAARPSAEDVQRFWSVSPIAHVDKVGGGRRAAGFRNALLRPRLALQAARLVAAECTRGFHCSPAQPPGPAPPPGRRSAARSACRCSSCWVPRTGGCPWTMPSNTSTPCGEGLARAQHWQRRSALAAAQGRRCGAPAALTAHVPAAVDVSLQAAGGGA